jgi:quercetin dioxygenase-like cupin family protein
MQNIHEVLPREFIPGFFGRFVHGAQTTLAYVEITQGSTLNEHSHVHEQITFLLEGELEMIIGGEKMTLTAGSFHVISSNTPHSAFAVTNCKVIDAFSPARDDYR